MVALFDDAALIRAALDFEVAVAQACAKEGLIADRDSVVIADVAAQLDIDAEALTAEAQHAGTLAIPLVGRLRDAVSDVSTQAASAVHRGCTSQDVLDTVCALQCRRAAVLLEDTGWAVCDKLADMALEHADTRMLGRTLLRGAWPITFGLKVSNWLSGLADALARLSSDASVLGVQLGGAVGTRAGLEGNGEAVARRVAESLGLPERDQPWHTQRNDTAALATSIAIVGGGLAKMAMDIALLGQDELAELFEKRQAGRGGSSATRGR